MSHFDYGYFSSNKKSNKEIRKKLLKSRTIIESVINRFNMVTFYEAEDIEEAIEELTDNTQFVIENEGTIRISCYVSTGWLHPETDEELAKNLSANIVTYFIERLDLVNTGLKSKQATFQRAFIEERYNKNILDLHNAEEKLKIFQEKNKLIALPEQTNAAIELAASIKTKIMLNEVELNLLKSTLNHGHPEINHMVNEIVELKRKLNELENGNNLMDITINEGLFPVFSKVPEMGLQLLRLTREVEIQNTLFTFLTQKYEEAKIQEAKDTPSIQILDPAAIPIKKYRPRRLLLVMTTSLISLIMIILYFVSVENYSRNNTLLK